VPSRFQKTAERGQRMDWLVAQAPSPLSACGVNLGRPGGPGSDEAARHHHKAIVINTQQLFQIPHPAATTATTTTTSSKIPVSPLQHQLRHCSISTPAKRARRNGRQHPCCPAAGRHHHLEMRNQGRPTSERETHHSLLVYVMPSPSLCLGVLTAGRRVLGCQPDPRKAAPHD